MQYQTSKCHTQDRIIDMNIENRTLCVRLTLAPFHIEIKAIESKAQIGLAQRGSALHSYLRWRRFEYRTGRRSPGYKFSWYSCESPPPPQIFPDIISVKPRTLPLISFPIHPSSYHSTLYSPRYWPRWNTGYSWRWTGSTTHNRRKYNPPTQTRMRIEGTCILTTSARTEDSKFLTKDFNTWCWRNWSKSVVVNF
jgi:hypothetical protein